MAGYIPFPHAAGISWLSHWPAAFCLGHDAFLQNHSLRVDVEAIFSPPMQRRESGSITKSKPWAFQDKQISNSPKNPFFFNRFMMFYFFPSFLTTVQSLPYSIVIKQNQKKKKEKFFFSFEDQVFPWPGAPWHTPRERRTVGCGPPRRQSPPPLGPRARGYSLSMISSQPSSSVRRLTTMSEKSSSMKASWSNGVFS